MSDPFKLYIQINFISSFAKSNGRFLCQILVQHCSCLTFFPSPSGVAISSFTLIWKFNPFSGKVDIWSVRRLVEWRPCSWWLQGHLTALPSETNGYIRVDCYGGLNQMRRDFCDGVGVARLLNATLVQPKFEVASYWNETSGFADVYDVDYFVQQMSSFIKVVKQLTPEIASKEPVQVDCSKLKANLIIYPLYAKAALCQACYSALRLTRSLEMKASKLLDSIPKPFLSLRLRFEPDMVAYSQCEHPGLSPGSTKAIEAAQVKISEDTGYIRKPWTGDLALTWRKRGKCSLNPNETALILQSLSIPTNTNIYLAAGDGLMEIKGLKDIHTNTFTKSSLLNDEDFTSMHGNTKAAMDYYVSINSDSFMATYFGNMDKMVSAMRAYKEVYKTIFLSRRAFAELTDQGLSEKKLMEDL